MTDTYDAQIAALLKEDYVEFDVQARQLGRATRSHLSAWGGTGDVEGSLFAYIPGADFNCASQIEHLSPQEIPAHGHLKDLRDIVMKDSRLSLPRQVGPTLDCRRDGPMFTRAELEEFARRQRVARAAS